MSMKREMVRLLVVGIFPTLGWIIPASLWGQVLPVAGAFHASASAAELEDRAEALFSTPSRFGEAGVLLEQAGRALPVEDPAAVDLLIRAARLEYYAGDHRAARQCMRDAAWRALGQGQVQRAANAYADAALIAIEEHDAAAANELVGIVQLLTKWPGITAAERRQIAGRIR